MLWTPREHRIGDITIVRVGEEYHLFTEQTPLDPGGGIAGRRTVGHAVSRDLLRWEELPAAFGCGPAGDFDAYSIYHMDVFLHRGTWYLFYTGLDRPGPGQQQAIGLATSRDGMRWEKHPANPVLRADPRCYEPSLPREATYQEKDFGRLWFRDPCVISAGPDGPFGMIVVARDVRQPPDVRGCLAWATSKDLVRWEAHPPLYSPGRFHTIETPSLFRHEGRHYLVFMTHPGWGVPVMATDPYQTAGDFYAVSERGWTGPYERPADEVVVAAHGTLRMGGARTVEGPGGERYLYGWLAMKPGPGDETGPLVHPLTVPPPRHVRFLGDGSMHVRYHEGIESFAESVPPAPAGMPEACGPRPEHWKMGNVVSGKNLGGRAWALWPGEQANVIFSARVRFERGERAGLLLRADAAASSGWRVVADRRFGRIEFGILGQETWIDARSWPPADAVDIKVVAHGPSVEVYADGRLMIHQVRYREVRGRLGYWIERAEAHFENPVLLRFREA
ncbi:MAG: hypothetical protein HYU36_06580 [Planctomycetes bacterium]|nr:hypothetical protein [Planctomycetota bacterium]